MKRTPKKLLEESEKTLEGDGLRTGEEDGISQALTTVLDTAKNNIEELEKTISNTAELCQGLADNFANQDSWISQNIQNGKFVGNAPERAMPASYKEYLERDGIFDDVKDVLQAFDNQVEKRSREFAKKVSELYKEHYSEIVTAKQIVEVMNTFACRSDAAAIKNGHIVNGFMFEHGNVDALLKEQREKTYYMPEKEELLRYEDPHFYEMTPQLEKLADYVRKTYTKNEEKIKEFFG